MVVVPRPVALTRPVADTVATAGFEDDHEASAVTSWVVPFESVAVAVSWLVCPIAARDAVPVTAMEDVVGVEGVGVVGLGLDDPPQAIAAMRNANGHACLTMGPLRACMRDGTGDAFADERC